MKKNEIVKYILVPVLLIVIVFLLIERDDKVQVTEKEVLDGMQIPSQEAPESREAPKSYDTPEQEPQQPESKPEEKKPDTKKEDEANLAYYQEVEGAFILMADGMDKVSLGVETGDIYLIQEGADSIMLSSDKIYSLNPPSEAKESHRLLIGLADVNGRIASGVYLDLESGYSNYLSSYEFIMDLQEATEIMQEYTIILESETLTEGVVNTL